MLDDSVSLKDVKFFPQVKLYPINYSLALYMANTFSFVLRGEFLFSKEEAVNTLL